MTATAGLPVCLAVQRDKFCHPHYIEGFQQQNKAVVPLGNLSPPWEGITSFMDISMRFFATNPCILAKCTVMVYIGHCVIKHNSRCIKTYLQNGIKTPLYRRTIETKAEAPPGLWPPVLPLSAATCGHAPRAPLGRMTCLRHLSHDCSFHVQDFQTSSPWKNNPSLSRKLAPAFPFCGLFFFAHFSQEP